MNKPREFKTQIGGLMHEIYELGFELSELKEKLAVASESLTYERRERYKSDKKLLEKLAIVKSALEFYAERDNYCLYEDLSVDEWKYNWIAERPHPQKIDKVGALATKALAKINEGE